MKTKSTYINLIAVIILLFSAGMGTGNKSSQVIAWTFLTKDEQTEWRETRWG